MSYADGRGENFLDDEPAWETDKPAGRRLLILAAVLFVGFLIAAGGLAGVRALWKPALPPREVETAEEKWRRAAEAFGDQAPPLEHPELAAIEGVLEIYGAALRNRDVAIVRSSFDFDRMVLELERLGALREVSFLERMQVPQELARTLPDRIVEEAVTYAYSRFEIRRLDQNDGEIVVYSRHWADDGLNARYRWWMRKSEGRWRIFDFEALETTERLTDVMAGAISEITPGRAAIMQHAAESLGQALLAAAEEDWERAERILGMTNVTHLPRVFQPKLHLVQASVDAAYGRYEQALQACDRAAALSDMPLIAHHRAVAYNGLGRYDEALAATRQYLDRLGADFSILLEKGVALSGLGRNDEAIEAYRQGLRDNPESIDLLFQLGLLLPDNAKGEIGERFARMGNPEEQFEVLCEAFIGSGDIESVATVAGAYRAIAPEDPLVPYYEAWVKHSRGEHESAAEQLLAALDRAGEEQREAFVTLYFEAMLAVGKLLQAYRHAADPEGAFSYLAGQALRGTHDDELLQLIEVHRAGYPNDPWLDYHTGRLAADREDWDAAIVAFREGMKKLEGEDAAASFRYGLSDAMARRGRAVEAYRELGADRETFTQIAWQLSLHEQPEHLRDLVAAFDQDHPNEHTTPFWQAEAHFVARDYAAAVQTIEDNASILMTHDDTRWRSEDRLIRSLIHLKRFDDADSYAQALANRDDDIWYAALVAAARGDLAETERLLDRCIEEHDWEPHEFYDDTILAAALENPAFRALREKYPHWDDPVEAPSPQSLKQLIEAAGDE